MYKKLILRLWQLIRYPADAWKDLALTVDDKKSYLSDFFYPLMGLASFSAFARVFFNGDLAFKQQIIEGAQLFVVAFASIFAGLFLSAKVLDAAFVRWFGQAPAYNKAEQLVVYAQAPILAISVLTRLVPELFFLKLLFLYVFAIVWEASMHFYTIPTNKQGLFTLMSGALILIAPQAIEVLLKLLLPS